MREWTPLEGLCPKEIPYRGGDSPRLHDLFLGNRKYFKKAGIELKQVLYPFYFSFILHL